MKRIAVIFLFSISLLWLPHASAQGLLPSLPALHSLSVGGEVNAALGSNTWKNPSAVPGLNLEVGLLVYPHINPNVDALPDPPYSAVTVYVGTAFASVAADLTTTLHANSALRDNYVGARYLYRFAKSADFFVGGDVRFMSFDSGRVYENDPMRTTFKLSGNGLGAEINFGVSWQFLYVQFEAAGRYFPSIVVDPPSGVSLPNSVPASATIWTVGISAGLQVSFDRDKNGKQFPFHVTAAESPVVPAATVRESTQSSSTAQGTGSVEPR